MNTTQLVESMGNTRLSRPPYPTEEPVYTGRNGVYMKLAQGMAEYTGPNIGPTERSCLPVDSMAGTPIK